MSSVYFEGDVYTFRPYFGIVYLKFGHKKKASRLYLVDIFVVFQIFLFLHINYFWVFKKDKLFILILVTLYKTLCENVILRRHVFVFLHIISQLSPRLLCALKIEVILNVKFLSSLVFCNCVILGGQTINISKQCFKN